MNKELETKLKQQYELYKNTNAASIKQHVILPLLEGYDYDLEKIKYSNATDANEFIVEVDKVDELLIYVVDPQVELNIEIQEALVQRLSVRQKIWGLLTNGQDYLLMNSTIIRKNVSENHNQDRDEIVFKLNLFNKKDLEYLNYISRKNLFEKGVTEYFKHIAQFKAQKYSNGGRNWAVYRGTLFSFFHYYAQQVNSYVELDRITVSEFEEYLKKEMQSKSYKGKKIVSSETLSSKYSYVRSLFKELDIKGHKFAASKSELLSRIQAKDAKEYDEDFFTDENIRKILRFYDTTRESVRNKTMFLLCLAYGFDRSTLINLSFDKIQNRHFVFENRKLPIPSKLWSYIEELKEGNMEKGVGEYFFYGKYRGEMGQVSESQINYVFDILQEIDLNDAILKMLNPAYIRFTLIKKLFKSNFSLEEIIYYTGVDFPGIANLISIETVIEQVNNRKTNSEKVHPFAEFLGKF